MSRASLALLLGVVAVTGYFVYRERALGEQRRHEFRTSPNRDDAGLYSHTVFAIGNLLLAFDSTKTESALWLVHSADTFRTWMFPPPVRPVELVRLIQWQT